MLTSTLFSLAVNSGKCWSLHFKSVVPLVTLQELTTTLLDLASTEISHFTLCVYKPKHAVQHQKTTLFHIRAETFFHKTLKCGHKFLWEVYRPEWCSICPSSASTPIHAILHEEDGELCVRIRNTGWQSTLRHSQIRFWSSFDAILVRRRRQQAMTFWWRH